MNIHVWKYATARINITAETLRQPSTSLVGSLACPDRGDRHHGPPLEANYAPAPERLWAFDRHEGPGIFCAALCRGRVAVYV